VVTVDKGRMRYLGPGAVDSTAIIENLFDVLLWCIAQDSLLVTLEVTTKAELGRSSPFQLEVVLIDKCFDDDFRNATCNH